NNSLNFVAANAASTRLVRWWGLDTKRPNASIRIFSDGDAPSYPDGRDYRGWSLADPTTEAHQLDMFTPVGQQIEWLLRKRAPYLTTLPSNALALAFALKPEDVRELSLEAIVAISETVLPRAREIIAERIGAKLLALYS